MARTRLVRLRHEHPPAVFCTPFATSIIAFASYAAHIEGMKRHIAHPLIIALSLGLLTTACSQSHSPCGDGTAHYKGAERICAYQSSVVIEGGFECPDFAPALIEIEGGYVCAPEHIRLEDLPAEVCPWSVDGCMAPTRMSETDAGPADLDARIVKANNGNIKFDAGAEPSDGGETSADATIECGCSTDAECPGGAAQSKCLNCACLPYPAACFDGVKNGVETDVDCGGEACPRCYAGESCSAREDCATGKCDGSSGLCVALSGDELACLGLDDPSCAACHAVGGQGVNLWPTSRDGLIPPPPPGLMTDGLVEACL